MAKWPRLPDSAFQEKVPMVHELCHTHMETLEGRAPPATLQANLWRLAVLVPLCDGHGKSRTNSRNWPTTRELPCTIRGVEGSRFLRHVEVLGAQCSPLRPSTLRSAGKVIGKVFLILGIYYDILWSPIFRHSHMIAYYVSSAVARYWHTGNFLKTNNEVYLYI